MEQTVAGISRHHAGVRPDHVALVSGARRTTYGELDRRASRVAQGLLADRLAPQARVAVLDKNSDAFFEILFGAAKARVALVAVNWRLAPPEVAYVLNDAATEILFVGPEFFPVIAKIRGELRTVRRIVALTEGAPDVAAPPESGSVGAILRVAGPPGRPRSAASRRAGRRGLADVHERHHRAPQGRADHPHESPVAFPGGDTRVGPTLDSRGRRAGLHADLPHRREWLGPRRVLRRRADRRRARGAAGRDPPRHPCRAGHQGAVRPGGHAAAAAESRLRGDRLLEPRPDPLRRLAHPPRPAPRVARDLPVPAGAGIRPHRDDGGHHLPSTGGPHAGREPADALLWTRHSPRPRSGSSRATARPCHRGRWARSSAGPRR